MSLLQMSISGGVMILVVTVIRALTINRFPKKTFLALWGIVLVRLLLPFSWPSPLSFYSLISHPMAERIGGAPVANILPVGPGTNSITTPPTGFLPWVWIWGAGAVLCTLYFTAVYVKCRREFRTSQPVENEFTVRWLSEYKCKRPITIRQTSGVSAPLTYGIFSPVILMPVQTDWTDTRKLQYVLAHEYVHIRRLDGATKIILTFALCIHWFNPLVWVMYTLSNRDMELSCDEKVIRIFGETIKSAYALALISMEERKRGITPLYNNFSKNAIEERIEAVMKMKKTSVAAVAVALCLVGGVTTVFATSSNAEHNSLQQETGIAITQTGGDGSTLYSTDGGKSWLSQTQWDTQRPDIEWWTYDEYKSWVDEQKIELPKLIGTGNKYLKDGEWVEFTQESVDESIRRYENILVEIKNGARLSKNVNEVDSIATISTPPSDGDIGVSYGAAMSNQNGEDADLGDFSSKEERLIAVRQYCEKQVKDGVMSQEEADTIMKEYE